MPTSKPTASDTRDFITDEQKIEWIATVIMRWHCQYVREEGGIERLIGYKEDVYKNAHAFQPLSDWNCWRKVEEKVMEDEKLNRKFWMILEQMPTPRPMDGKTYWNIFAFPLPTRCRALFLAYYSLHP